MTTAERFREFATAAARQNSPLYAEWADRIVVDDVILRLIDQARPGQRQPVLVFAVARLLGAPEAPYEALHEWLIAHREAFLAELDVRLTQTNDVRRVAPVALALAEARLDGPVALLEVGAAAGLGLYPDRYRIDVASASGSRTLGDPQSSVRLTLRVEGEPRGAQDPRALPSIRHRAGLDVAPLDVRRAADAVWLETLLWPGQGDRVALLRSAVDVARRDPAAIAAGDAVDGLDSLVSGVPAGITPVVVTAGTLVYLPGARRQEFVDAVARLGVRWISYEKTGLLAGIHATLGDPARSLTGSEHFATLALDGRALGTGDAHGTRLNRP
ncbi:hypothetical protein GCM10025867_15470 [Frondihabitans sucicola]|uniref:DUF2332 domain-containing protein n=1 Tax=Frondihabitans sucicola TaxID=1268041 RepID=A0ABM8GLQ9_9MICO|nr:DUF2332 domain-containing protein [Frondihabitans sucicola]BDZ49306.1 hypothetical protein GCM10025867_15470 [Frondihabitans sucicola]